MMDGQSSCNEGSPWLFGSGTILEPHVHSGLFQQPGFLSPAYKDIKITKPEITLFLVKLAMFV